MLVCFSAKFVHACLTLSNCSKYVLRVCMCNSCMHRDYATDFRNNYTKSAS